MLISSDDGPPWRGVGTHRGHRSWLGTETNVFCGAEEISAQGCFSGWITLHPPPEEQQQYISLQDEILRWKLSEKL